MKWWKVIGTIIAAPIVASLSNCLHAQVTGGHCALTAGNVIIPGLGTALLAVAALFTKPPHQP